MMGDKDTAKAEMYYEKWKSACEEAGMSPEEFMNKFDPEEDMADSTDISDVAETDEEAMPDGKGNPKKAALIIAMMKKKEK